MLNNVITFSASKEFIKNNQDNLPVLTKTNIPEWYKKLTHSYEMQTVKGCMPFLDTLTAGYILKIPTDYKIRHNIEFEGKKRAGFDSAQQMMNSLAEKININYQGKGEFHSTEQLEGSPLVEKNKNLAFHKILNPWIIRTPPGYSTLFVPPLNNSDDRFSIIAGIVDTDNFVNEINFPITINGDKYEILDTIIERGTPYVQCIPFKREDWKMKIKVMDDKKYMENRFFMVKYLVHNYKKLFWKKKSWK
tara:strand:- start:1371 stop:2114 length:744 start_codon:yes stop_codon:yes gene_type:complete